MTIRPKLHRLFALMVLGLGAATAVPAGAQEYGSQAGSGLSATLQINFGTPPRWTAVPGTGVRIIRERERPDYDMFQYRGRYYVYRNDSWYVCRRSRGRFTSIDDRAVPRALFNVPRGQWRHYPTGWMDRNRNSGSDDHGRGRDGRHSESSDERRRR